MRAPDATTRLPERYRVVRHIANGGMASVWAAEDELLGRLVAVKVLAPGYAADPDARRRFTREARAAARVSDHPHVVTVYDIGETEADEPEAFIVMEHLAGGTVSQRLRAPEPVPVPTTLRWLEEAASALDAAHAADIVHRDVKPGNLLLDERGRLAVGDFGIASIQGETALTQAGQIVGTAAYLSPEQGRGEAATSASDRYSLAVVAYELLCGRRPFEGDTPVAQMHAHIHAEPPEPDGMCAAAADALRHGLAKDPAARPHTAAAFVRELREAVGDAAEPVTAPTRVRSPAAPAAPIVAAPAAASGGAATPRTPRPARTPPPAPAPTPAPAPAAAARGGRTRFPLVLAGALGTGAVIAVIAAAATGGGDDPGAAADRTPTAAQERTTERPRETQPAPEEQPAAQPEPAAQEQAPADGRGPAELNDAGYALLPGDPQQAIPLLQRAVAGFRETGRTGEQAYAFALYNLGWALRLSGRPDAAIPYLQERLRYPDSSGDAERELARAQREAGGDAAAGSGNGNAKGWGRGGRRGGKDDD